MPHAAHGYETARTPAVWRVCGAVGQREPYNLTLENKTYYTQKDDKEYYVKLGKERDYNVPTFTRIKDSLGNDIVRPASTASCSWEMFCNGSFAPKIQLRSGDRYKLCVEVDGGFDPSTYTIQWVVVQNLSDVICRGTGNTVDFALNVENVSYRPEIRIDLISKKAWHRFHKTDDYIIMNLEDVLPPIEDTY